MAKKKTTRKIRTKFTPKKKFFADEYLKDLNATKAAIRAGYSKRTAGSQGQRLLMDVDIKKYIKKAKAERSKRTKIDADWLLSRLAEEAEADVADLYNKSGGLKSVHEWPEIWRQGLVAGLDVHQEYADGAPDGVVMKIKISDRIRRLELIGKHVDVQAFSEKHEHTGPNGGPQEHVIIDKKEYAKIRQKMIDDDDC